MIKETKPKLKTFISKSLIYHIIYKRKEIRLKDEFYQYRKKFDDFLRRYSADILKNIKKVIGGDWKEAEIIIYLVPGNSPIVSIPHPLILKLRKDMYFNLHIFTHELVHRYLEISFNQYEKFVSLKHIGLNKNEALTDYITRIVGTKTFGSRKTKEFTKKEYSIITSRNIKECDKLIKKFKKKWDLEKHPLIYYLKHLKN